MWGGLDANKHLITNLSLQRVHEKTSTKEISLDKEIIRALDFALYDDSCFIIPDYSGKHRFHIIDMNGGYKIQPWRNTKRRTYKQRHSFSPGMAFLHRL